MPLKMKSMKSLDFSCASPASTAICSSTDQNFMVKNSTKSLNRFNSFINNNNNNNDHYYNKTSSPSPRAPCISELPFTPRLSSSYREKTRKKPPLPTIVKHSDLTPRRKSSADIDLVRRRYYDKASNNNLFTTTTSSPQRSHSSRYLLGESKFLDSLSHESHHQNQNQSVVANHNHNNIKKMDNEKDDALALVPSTPLFEGGNNSFGSFLDAEKEKKINRALALVNTTADNQKKVINHNHNNKQQQKSMGYCRNDSLVLKKSPSSGARSRDQVVVLRVSLHCKGCEGKLRKHLSRMEGVSSFSIDLETKKVTVIGNVTPVGVLTSISKVKNAQFWPSAATTTSPPSSSSSSTTSSSTVDFN